MNTEYEAIFINIDKSQVRKKLKELKAEIIKPEFLQKRIAFDIPNNNYRHSWARVRDEMDKITMTLKIVMGREIQDHGS